MPSVTKKRLQELEGAADYYQRELGEMRKLYEERLRNQELAHAQINKYNEYLLNTIVDFTSRMVTPAAVMISKNVGELMISRGLDHDSRETVEIPDCLKPRDVFEYLQLIESSRPFQIGDRVSHKHDGRVGAIDKVGACTLGVRWDNEGWNSCPIEDIRLVKGKE